MPVDAFKLTESRWHERFSPQRFAAEMLNKRWMDAALPLAILVGMCLYFGVSVSGFFGISNLAPTTELLAEYGLLALAMAVVLIGGGIDLSVGSIYAVANAVAVVLYKLENWPTVAVVLAALAVGAACGTVNGLLISVLKTRPFITTLITLELFRTVAVYMTQTYSSRAGLSLRQGPVWTGIGNGHLLDLPIGFWVFAVLVIVGQYMLTRSRLGWRIMAMGASRTAARRAGLQLNRLGFQTYVLSGILCGLSGLFVASRLGSVASTTGLGYELVALTAVVLGGVGLTGGRGTAFRALLGTAIVTLLYQGMIAQGSSANTYDVALAALLVVFVAVDLKYAKNKDRAIQKIYITPGRVRLGRLVNVYETNSVWHPNTRLSDAEPIGLGMLDGPEDVVLDRDGNLYCGDRRGWIWQFRGDDLSQGKVFARIGGLPLGLAVRDDGTLVACVGGMGLYAIDANGGHRPLATQTRRSIASVRDDSAVRLSDDLDVAPDGKIYFSDASTRFDGIEYMFDVMEGRANGRVLCFDPRTKRTTVAVKNVPFPNGICVSHDGNAIFICSTILCRVDRLWIDGPKAGTLESFIENTPGLPDNINRSSDGCYWLAFAAMRTPTFDLALEDPGFRRRMLKEIPQDEWLMPNLNTSCVAKVSEEGEILETLWDETQESHSLITSMREHDGWLYLGGLTNNRVGRIVVGEGREAAPSVGMATSVGEVDHA